jgi:septal ring factor EnvC (AmiA/AmiB activator)
MKTLKLAAILFLAVIMVTGCGKKKEKQILDLQEKGAQLAVQYEKKDSMMNELFNSMNDIERNLSDITAREKLITDAPNDEKRMNMDVRDKIMDEIILINNIMAENKKKLASLQEQLKKSNTKIASLEETIKLLTKRIEEKESEIADLKEQLRQLNFTISQQDAMLGEMNTIWYVSGTKKELTDKGVIEKAGGLFSGEQKMTEMIDPGNFRTGDMRKISKIPLDCKEAVLVTTHPDGSYKFTEENEKITGIEITNPTEFWKSSRFLVIMTK